MSDFPKIEAGKLAVAAQAVLVARGPQLGPAMERLQKALTNYDCEVMALGCIEDESMSDKKKTKRQRRSTT